MAARKTCYKSRENNGREIRYKSPGSLLAQAYRYFEWCDSNPWHKAELIRSGARVGEVVELPVSRPYTIEGLCVFCGISLATFARYESDPHFGEAIEHLRLTIRQQQLEGECIGVYNANALSKVTTAEKKEEADQPSELVINVLSHDTKENLETLKKNLSG
ncbi:MAG: hypothetical protein KH100_04945 [Dysgonomonas mossii]|uniref:terminase small subunit n=1 Tax=Dysgonomonas mossii TaxID=163665 RepID=UPI001DB3C23A|nr:terminase small subunit [Dysgonomonas mossii]MBS5795654.1 hypothetical protein [Dysgonomonas mossii]MBS7110533.1 hypothetical protein [Dysgonomonas mossii]